MDIKEIAWIAWFTRATCSYQTIINNLNNNTQKLIKEKERTAFEIWWNTYTLENLA